MSYKLIPSQNRHGELDGSTVTRAVTSTTAEAWDEKDDRAELVTKYVRVERTNPYNRGIQQH